MIPSIRAMRLIPTLIFCIFAEPEPRRRVLLRLILRKANAFASLLWPWLALSLKHWTAGRGVAALRLDRK